MPRSNLCEAKRVIRAPRHQTRKKSAPDVCSSGARGCLPNQLPLVAVLVVAGENFEQVVFAVLLRKEKPGSVCP
jgi:hypothetical protein